MDIDSRPTSEIARLAELVSDARSVVALTGAGISVPSGIPDFRTPQTGLWEKVDPMEVAHIDAFRSDPARFWSFYGRRFATLEDKQPNGAHRALVAMEERGLLDAVITQNIDMLHRKAGTHELVEMLDERALERARELCRRADVLLCIGSSLEVHPVAGLPLITHAAGGELAILTQGATPLDELAGVRLHGDVVTELDALLGALDADARRTAASGSAQAGI